jgi:EAL domain-containing protein (putative c-di-GMP-specific phosphodiesterase class I)
MPWAWIHGRSIETMDQLELIRKLNVTHVQGFIYSER